MATKIWQYNGYPLLLSEWRLPFWQKTFKVAKKGGYQDITEQWLPFICFLNENFHCHKKTLKIAKKRWLPKHYSTMVIFYCFLNEHFPFHKKTFKITKKGGCQNVTVQWLPFNIFTLHLPHGWKTFQITKENFYQKIGTAKLPVIQKVYGSAVCVYGVW